MKIPKWLQLTGEWLKWRWEVFLCVHSPGPWTLFDMGMRKVRWCTKCKVFLGDKDL